MNNRFLMRQKGQILLMLAVLSCVVLVLLGFLIDVGMIYNAKAELKIATDGAALAAALDLDSPSAITATVQSAVSLNPVQNSMASISNITLGRWDDKTQSFDASTTSSPTAVQVTTGFEGHFYFMSLFSAHTYTLTSTSIASITDDRPLTIYLVTDISPNMSWASQLQGVGMDNVTHSSVIDNLTSIYNQLNAQGIFNSPDYGILSWDQFVPGLDVSGVLTQFNLQGQAYPYEGYSWADYVKYAQNVSYDANAYLQHYGFLTLINFWQEVAFSSTQTPILKTVAEQPLQAVKNGVSYLAAQLNPSLDQLGLVVISPNEGLVSDLTMDYTLISSALNNFQAGEYGPYNGAVVPAINTVIDRFSQAITPNAKKILLLFLNGATNWDENSSNNTYDNSGTIEALKQGKIYSYGVVIGPNSNPSLITNLVQQTGGEAFCVRLASLNYMQQM
ncbi:MAG: pilus assembly protein TadG-related protein, partial [Legionellales bacterium]